MSETETESSERDIDGDDRDIDAELRLQKSLELLNGHAAADDDRVGVWR
jgi:hypothetical protein